MPNETQLAIRCIHWYILLCDVTTFCSWTTQTTLEHFVLMDMFGSRLRQRAKDLGISNSEAARRAGLTERRYGHYIVGNREPDLATLVRIANVLGSSPNWLLGLDDIDEAVTPISNLLDRLNFAARSMTAEDLELLTVQAEAIVKLRAAAGDEA